MEEKIRTRFAPSPTGYLHIGGARTAFFNYLFAKKNKGKFILRIEDTDIKRNNEKFLNSIYEDLIWLGLNPNESIFKEGLYGPYIQTNRLDIYKKIANKLLDEKKIYYCFCSVEDLIKEKKDYIKEKGKKNYKYSRKCLNLNDQEINNLIKKKIPKVLRVKVPSEKKFFFRDLIRGNIIFLGENIEDFIVIRQNDIPSYNFACVLDDYFMKISHVLRGQEHISNSAKQLVLYYLLEWEIPYFGHFSIITNKEKKKLSKRNEEDLKSIKDLRELGYLPQSITNYLLFLGWHPGSGNNKEFFSIQESIDNFDLENINKRNPSYSLEKLNWYNNHYIRNMDIETFKSYCWLFLSNEFLLDEKEKHFALEISFLFRERINFFKELPSFCEYFFNDPDINLDLKFNKKWIEETLKILKLSNWNEDDIKKSIKFFSEKIDYKKEYFSKLRKILTGKEKGPELPKIIFYLGYDKVERRLLKLI